MSSLLESLANDASFDYYSSLVIKIAKYVYLIYTVYTLFLSIIASALAAHQERKIWLDRSKQKCSNSTSNDIDNTTRLNKTPAQKVPELPLYGLFKVFIFNFVWMILCSIGSLLVIYKKMLTFGLSDTERDAHVGVEQFVAKAVITTMIGKVTVKGKEHLPKACDSSTRTPVYIANHSSQIDVGVVYYISELLPFKWIAKESTVFLPGVGSIMYLSKHIFINRNKKSKSRNSPSNLYRQCNESIQEKRIPIFFFPQGTRQIQQRLPFKNGAFVVATENKSPLIPISIEIPVNVWQGKSLFSKTVPEVVITIHKPISVNGTENMDHLKKITFDQIYSVLPDTWSLATKETQSCTNKKEN